MTDHERHGHQAAPPARSDEADTPASAAVDAALRALPELAVPEHVWQSVRDGVDVPPIRRRRRIAPSAAAASVLLGVAAALLVALSLREAETTDTDIKALLERSRVVEAERRATPMVLAPSGVERVLKVRIGGIDDLLNEQLLRGTAPDVRQTLLPERAELLRERAELLRERVELMEDLRHIERYRQRELFQQAVF